MMYSKRHLPDIEQWSQSSGSNVIPRRARPGLAGLRPCTLRQVRQSWELDFEELKASFTFSPASPPPARVNGSNANPMAPASAEASHPARASPEEFDHQRRAGDEFDHDSEDVDAAPWRGIASPDPPGANTLTNGQKYLSGGRGAGMGGDVLGEVGGGDVDAFTPPGSYLSVPPALSHAMRQRSSASVTSIEEV